MEKYDSVKKKLCDEFDVIGRKFESGAEMSDTDLTRLERITHTLKSMAAYKASEGSYENMSGRMARSYSMNEGGGESFAEGYSRGFADARGYSGMQNGNSGMFQPMWNRGYGYDGRNW